MTYPSVEVTIQVPDSEERTAGIAGRAAIESREDSSSPLPPTREDAGPTPVCAACWAY
jgi:hypothetical protein